MLILRRVKRMRDVRKMKKVRKVRRVKKVMEKPMKSHSKRKRSLCSS
jgi:hypothetical protein